MMFTSNKRRCFAAVVVAALALTAIGCSSNSAPTAGDEQQCLAMSFGGGDLVVWNDTLKFMEPEIEAAGYCFLTHDPQWDPQKQVQDWQTWIARGDVAAIMGFAIQGDALVPVTADAEAAGIPVISYLDTWEGAIRGFYVDDFEDAAMVGTDAGEWLNDNTGSGQTTVAILGERTNDSLNNRMDGVAAGVEKSTSTKVDFVELTQGSTREDGYNQAKAQLAADPNTRVWVAISDDLAKGVYQALLDSGVAADDPNYFVGSLDATEESVKLIGQPGSIYRVAYMVTPEAISDVNVALLLAAAKGEPMGDGKRVIFERVTSENAGDIFG